MKKNFIWWALLVAALANFIIIVGTFFLTVGWDEYNQKEYLPYPRKLDPTSLIHPIAKRTMSPRRFELRISAV
jgi:hypothetical protein